MLIYLPCAGSEFIKTPKYLTAEGSLKRLSSSVTTFDGRILVTPNAVNSSPEFSKIVRWQPGLCWEA